MSILLGENIKKYRKKIDLSQAELAERLSVTRQAVSNWERGISEPDVDMLLRLSGEFDIALEALVGKAEEEVPDSNRRTSGILVLTQLLLFVLGTVFFAFTNRIPDPGALILLLFCPFMSITLYPIFGYFFRSGDYSLLSGYDARMHYDRVQLKKLVMTQELWIHFINTVQLCIFLMIYGFRLHLTESLILVTAVYLFSLIVGTLKIQASYENKLYTVEEDYQKSRYQTKVSYLLIALILLPNCILMGTGAFGSPEMKARIDEVGIVLWILALTMIPIPIIIIENGRIHRMVEAKEAYRPAKTTVVIFLACLLGNIYLGWQLWV